MQKVDIYRMQNTSHVAHFIQGLVNEINYFGNLRCYSSRFCSVEVSICVSNSRRKTLDIRVIQLHIVCIVKYGIAIMYICSTEAIEIKGKTAHKCHFGNHSAI